MIHEWEISSKMEKPPELMRGVWLTGHGDFNQLEIRHDIPTPQVSPMTF
jgi:hypothetical protein